MSEPDTLEITAEMVEAEARRFALTIAGKLLLRMAEKGISEQDLAEELGVSLRALRFYLRGQNWRQYLNMIAVTRSLEVRLEVNLTSL
jgi:predicted transcriptional regulator